MSARKVYWNGELRSRDDARFASDDHGVLYGLGFFETFRTCGGVPHRWEAHRTRLLAACECAGIVVPQTILAHDEAQLRRAVQDLLREHGLADGVFRYTVTAGAPAVANVAQRFEYPRPMELLTARALPAAPPTAGVKLRVLSLPRDNGEWVPRPKSLNFSNALLGAHELQRRRTAPEDEGLFLARDSGHVVEAVRHNIGWFDDGCFCYPAPELGAVDGTCLRWALGLGLRAEERRASLDELARADAVVLLNAVRGVTPVAELWDASDQIWLRSWQSHTHPHVLALAGRWGEALRATEDNA